MNNSDKQKTYDYLILLKKSNDNLADQVSQLLYVFAIAAFGFFIYTYPSNSTNYIFVVAAMVINWSITIFNKRKNGVAYFRMGLLIAAVGWIIGFQRNLFMAVLYALAAILEKQVKFPPEIGFSETEISFNSLPRKTLHWAEVSNVVIKDGLLTIDQKNNNLYQKEIDGDVTPEIEAEFNAFCKEQIDNQIL